MNKKAHKDTNALLKYLIENTPSAPITAFCTYILIFYGGGEEIHVEDQESRNFAVNTVLDMCSYIRLVLLCHTHTHTRGLVPYDVPFFP
jgi:hypothetical protein